MVRTDSPGRLIISGTGTPELAGTGSLVGVRLQLTDAGTGIMSIANVVLNEAVIDAVASQGISFVVRDSVTIARPLTMDAVTASAGVEIDIPVAIDNANDVLGYFLRFVYPAALANVVGVNSGSLTGSWGMPIFNEINPGEVLITAAGTAAVAGEGSLAEIRLQLVNNGSGDISLPEIELNDGVIDAITSDDRSFEIFDQLTLSIADVTANEGKVGSANFDFIVTLSSPTEAVLSVEYATVSGTAEDEAGDHDYSAVTGTLTFGPVLL